MTYSKNTRPDTGPATQDGPRSPRFNLDQNASQGSELGGPADERIEVLCHEHVLSSTVEVSH